MTIQEVHEKVQKLLALAHGSTNEHEAALAFARAQALLDRFNIEQATLDTPESLQEDETLESQTWETHTGRATVRWRTTLVSHLAKANGCHSFFIGGTARVIVSGKPSKLSTVGYLYKACAIEVERLARRNARGRGTAYANSYRHGCVEAVREAIAVEAVKTHADLRASAANASALIVVENAIAKVGGEAKSARDFARQTHQLRSRTIRLTNQTGYEAGQRDGAGIYGTDKRPALGTGAGRIQS